MTRLSNTLLLCLVLIATSVSSPLVPHLIGADEQEPPQTLEPDAAAAIPEASLDTPGLDVFPSDEFYEPVMTYGSLFDPPSSGYPGHERIHRAVLLGRLWMRGEYLAWSVSRAHLPPLLGGLSAADANLPADPADVDMDLLWGDFDAHDALRSGGRFRAGLWFTPDHLSGIEAGFLGIDDQDVRYWVSGLDVPVLARPIIDAQTGLADVVPVSYPGLQLGQTWIRSDVETLVAEVFWRHVLTYDENSRLDFLAGYRYLRLWDQLFVHDNFVSPNAESLNRTLVDRRDLFQSENQFHGGELGLIARWWNYRWALETLGRVAFGGRHTATDVDGWTLTEEIENDNTKSITLSDGGVLALPSNMGSHAQSEFAVVAEIGVRLEYAFSRQCRATLGYTFIWWSSVARVLDSVDLEIDPSQIPPGVNPNATQPEFKFRDGDFWMQGLSVGLQYDF